MVTDIERDRLRHSLGDRVLRLRVEMVDGALCVAALGVGADPR
ncbi:hypothetical protein ACWDHW_23850 [Streptomyces melanosporofaciens]